MQGRRKSKKRKTGKSMQHQTSTVTSNDNEDDDDDDEEVGDIRTNSNGEKKKISECLKIAGNVSFEFSNFGIFHQFLSNSRLTCLVTLFDGKLQVCQKLAKMDDFWHF